MVLSRKRVPEQDRLQFAASRRGGEIASSFLELCKLLTGRADIPVQMSAQILQALVETDSSFAVRMTALRQTLQASGVVSIGGFDRSAIIADEGLKRTAIEVMSALYLGQVGIGTSARVISYKDALMFRPTKDATIIPSYSHRETGYWTKRPMPAY